MGKIRHLLFSFFVFLLIGTSIQLKAFGQSHKVDSIQIIFNQQQLVLPGESFEIGIIAYNKNGKVSKTKGMKDGSSFWWNYRIEVTGGTWLSGRITVDSRMKQSIGRSVLVKAYPRRHPELKKELEIPLNYETAVTFRPTNQFDKAPGSQIKGELLVVFDNGMQREYKDLRKSKESDLFQFSGNGTSLKKGKFIIEPDINKIDRHSVSVIVNSLRNPVVADTFPVLLDYKHNYELILSGSSGMSGFSGSNGSNGSNGLDGANGQNGQHGEFGSDGPDIGVWADLYYDSILNCNLLYVFAQDFSTDKEYRYLLNPQGGSLKVSSVGGSGGSGGSGGDGGNGGNGKDGEIRVETHTEKRTVNKTEKRTVIKKEKKKVINSEGKEEEIEVEVSVEEDVVVPVEIDVEVSETIQEKGEDGGNGGWGGAGGFGGFGGYGGNIAIYVTDDAHPYQNMIVPESIGGSGGSHGSVGRGGRAGAGGYGNPPGRNGSSGVDGPSALGWADSGGGGNITIASTEEFMIYSIP